MKMNGITVKVHIILPFFEKEKKIIKITNEKVNRKNYKNNFPI